MQNGDETEQNRAASAKLCPACQWRATVRQWQTVIHSPVAGITGKPIPQPNCTQGMDWL